MDKIQQIKDLTNELLHHCHLYYDLDSPTLSDVEYDKKWDALKKLEDEANFWLANSPTRKVQGQVLDCFQKVQHSKPMLSAAKTKDVNEIKRFIGSQPFYASYKCDGLTLVCIYEGGKFKQAVTRGNGTIGEDVTEQAKMISNLPMSIPYDSYLELRGECVVSWSNFHKINEGLDEPYSHPRNLAAGSLRNLDTNITRQRNLSYVVFECVSDLYDIDGTAFDSKWDALGYLDYLGFETVSRCTGETDACVEAMQPDFYGYPVDGLIFEMCMKEYSKSLASTSHHEGCRIAFKWADSAYETILRDVIWDVGRSGVISPVAVFDEVDLDGALTTKATLHNLSIIENLELGIGDTITVYRSNMVIPKIDDNLTRSNTLVIPDTCPCCGYKAEVKYTNNSKFLMCTNPNCSAKKISQFTHFVSRNCMNIEGLSEKTLEALIFHELIREYKDIYRLIEHRPQLIQIDGLGEKSADNLLESIEESRTVKLDNFLAALGIEGIGTSAAKTIAEYFDYNLYAVLDAYDQGFDWTQLKDFGNVMANNMNEFFRENRSKVYILAEELEFIKPTKAEVESNPFMGKTLVVTGKLSSFTRESINEKILSLGAKTANAVSKNTDYLITNESSGSSKYKKAVELNISIIDEDTFLKMCEM